MRAWLVLALLLAVASPAEARLGGDVASFTFSPLIRGDTLFRFEGVYGSRFQFCAARHCRFGGGVLALDVWDREIVQESLVLPLPDSALPEDLLDRVAGLFLADAGLVPADRQKALAAFQDAYRGAQHSDETLAGGIQLKTYCAPSLDSVMLVLSQKKE